MTEKQDGTGALVVVHNSEVARNDPNLQRHETFVTLPENFQYIVGKGDKARRAITSDGYDYMNRSLGAMFFLPEFVPDESGDLVRNPIHRPDYIYMRMGAIWRNEHGQLVGATEDLEVDFKAVYQQARLETWNSEVALDEHGQPIFGEDGQPLVRVTSDTGGQYPKSANEKERDALKVLMQLRSHGMRYAQTVLRTRLLKVATGVKSLKSLPPGSQLKPTDVRIIGWRDEMTPNERQKKAAEDMGEMFRGARPDNAPSLSVEQMRTSEVDEPPEEVVQAVATDPGHMDDRQRFEQMQAEPKADVTVDTEAMTQEEMEEAIAKEYEEMQAALK
jgi:hypothetical protein